MILSSFILVALFLCTISAFYLPSRSFGLKRIQCHNLLQKQSASSSVVGENIPEEILKHHAINDMILVERFSVPEKSQSGIYVPTKEGKDNKYLAKVLSVPENNITAAKGRVVPIEELISFKVGDVIVVRDAWGIGPCNIEISKRFFSFHRAKHIEAVITKSSSDAQ